MGWASGTELMCRVIHTLQEHIPNVVDRQRAYCSLIDAFEDSDWDTQDDCLGMDDAFDAAMRELHPGWFEDEEDEEKRPEPSMGKIAFDAYNESRGGVNFQGQKTPSWEELPEGIRKGWEVAATAIQRYLQEA